MAQRILKKLSDGRVVDVATFLEELIAITSSPTLVTFFVHFRGNTPGMKLTYQDLAQLLTPDKVTELFGDIPKSGVDAIREKPEEAPDFIDKLEQAMDQNPKLKAQMEEKLQKLQEIHERQACLGNSDG